MIARLADLARREVSRETFEKLETYVKRLVVANQSQNLIGPSTVPDLWERHIADAAQLLGLSDGPGTWCDIGSGGGLPGVVIAILESSPVTLVEPRRLRADFLRETAHALRLRQVSVVGEKMEKVRGAFDYITARAVAPAATLFAMAEKVTHPDTLFLLPKGKSAQSELEELQRTWQGAFRLEPSRTSDEAAILVGARVRRKGKA